MYALIVMKQSLLSSHIELIVTDYISIFIGLWRIDSLKNTLKQFVSSFKSCSDDINMNTELYLDFCSLLSLYWIIGYVTMLARERHETLF